MRFLLDTNICIYALKQNEIVLNHLLIRSRADIAISVITEAELRTGVAKSTAAAKTLRLLENFLRPLNIVEFTSADAAAYGSVRAKLERSGGPIGPLDTLIAAQAVARRLVLVSNNEREFGRVAGLRLENWTCCGDSGSARALLAHPIDPLNRAGRPARRAEANPPPQRRRLQASGFRLQTSGFR
jgi:tRNA(fMet)-specific endonuclease VapC